jgi:hypothetical protein
MSEITDELRRQVQEQIAWYRQDSRKDWVKVHSRLEPVPSRYEVSQTYLLLKILERLESIDETLIMMHAAQDQPQPSAEYSEGEHGNC